MAGQHYHHGNSPAAWTGVIIAFIGFGVGSAFTVMAEPLGVVAGLVIVLLGGVAGLILRAMGLGQAATQPITAEVLARAKERASAGAGAAAGTVVAAAARVAAPGAESVDTESVRKTEESTVG